MYKGVYITSQMHILVCGYTYPHPHVHVQCIYTCTVCSSVRKEALEKLGEEESVLFRCPYFQGVLIEGFHYACIVYLRPNSENIFSLGDCSSVPTSRTAAAVAAESGVLKHNLMQVMQGGTPSREVRGNTCA